MTSEVPTETIDSFAKLLANGLISYSDLVENGFDELAMELMVTRSCRFKNMQRAEDASLINNSKATIKKRNRLEDDDADREENDDTDSVGHKNAGAGDGDGGHFHKRLPSSRVVLQKRAADGSSAAAATVSASTSNRNPQDLLTSPEQQQQQELRPGELDIVVCGADDVVLARREAERQEEYDLQNHHIEHHRYEDESQLRERIAKIARVE